MIPQAQGFEHKIERIVDHICVGMMLIAFGITFAHIIGRYVLRAPIFYSEELARFCFIWASLLGASIVHRMDEHTSVTYFVGLLPPKARHALAIARSVVILALLGGLIYQGFRLSWIRRGLRLSALNWSWIWFYSALPVGSVLMVFTTIRHIRARVREFRAA